MSGLISIGIPFFPCVKSYIRGNFCYFINPKIGTWVALPNYCAKILFDKKCAENQGEQYSKVYEVLAKNNIIRDSRFNSSVAPLEIKPLAVHFQPTGKCNLQCKYCYNDPKIRSKSMNMETMIRAVDYCFENSFAFKQPPIFLIYGGEPLTERTLLFEIVRYIRSKAEDTYIAVITNATLLTEEDILFFKAQNVRIIISFDGLPEFQAQNRHRTTDIAAADNVLSKLYLLKKHDYMTGSSILSVVTKEMSARLLECVLFLQDCGVTDVEFLSLNLLGNAQGMRAISTDITDFITSLKKIVDAIEDGRIRQLHMRNILRMLMPLFSKQNIKGELGNHRCGAGRNVIAITVDGKILACDMIPEQFNPEIGNVWDGITSLDKFDKQVAAYASDECKKCIWLYFCRNGCTGACASDNGDLNKRHQLTCATHKEMYPYLLEKIATDNGKLREYFNESTRLKMRYFT